MGVGWRIGVLSLFSMRSKPLLLGNLNFAVSSAFFSGVPQNLQNPRIPGSVIAAQELTVTWSLSGEKIVFCKGFFAYSLLL